MLGWKTNVVIGHMRKKHESPIFFRKYFNVAATRWRVWTSKWFCWEKSFLVRPPWLRGFSTIGSPARTDTRTRLGRPTGPRWSWLRRGQAAFAGFYGPTNLLHDWLIFSWEPALWLLNSQERVLRMSKKSITIFGSKQWLLSTDMKTKVVQHVPRINLSHFNFWILNLNF